MKKLVSLVLALTLALSLAACGGGSADNSSASTGGAQTQQTTAPTGSDAQPSGAATYTVGICNFVDDASLNQIIANIRAQLEVIGAEKGVSFVIDEDNCNTDANVMNQIIANFQADNVDLMVGVATPVAMAMQAATEGTDTPVVFAAVSDPLGAGLVDSLEAPGANITGTSDYLDTNAVMNLIFAANPNASKIGLLYNVGEDSSAAPIAAAKEYANPNASKIGLLYNVGEDSSAAPIAAAKEYLAAKGVTVVERTGTTVDEVMLAAQALVTDGVDAIFTPTDNTIMTAELAIYETLAEAGIPHYTGADSFALNGAFLGYGVDYANLGVETANMIAEILLDGKDAGSVPVKTFDNGTATVNTETCAAIGFDYDDIAAAFAPYCTKVQPITTAESFDDLAG